MKRLYVLRHAEAVDEVPDFERVLTQKGVDSVVKLAGEVRSSMPGVDVVLSSSAARALQTASIFVEQLGINPSIIKSSRLLYDAGATELFNIVSELQNDAENVLVVGHNPAVAYFVNLLLCEPLGKFPKAGLVSMEFNCSSWSNISRDSLAKSFYYF